MTRPSLSRILRDKAQGRRDLAALPFTEKIAILERLRERREAIAASPLGSRQRAAKETAGSDNPDSDPAPPGGPAHP